MGLVLTASANLITKVPLMFQFLPTIEMKASGGFVLWAWFLSIIPVRIICKKCKLLHPDIPFITFMNFFFLFLVSWPCRQKRRRKLRGNKFMYNENKNNNIVNTSECNRSKSSITNIKQLFPSRTNDECLLELKKNPSFTGHIWTGLTNGNRAFSNSWKERKVCH